MVFYIVIIVTESIIPTGESHPKTLSDLEKFSKPNTPLKLFAGVTRWNWSIIEMLIFHGDWSQGGSRQDGHDKAWLILARGSRTLKPSNNLPHSEHHDKCLAMCISSRSSSPSVGASNIRSTDSDVPIAPDFPCLKVSKTHKHKWSVHFPDIYKGISPPSVLETISINLQTMNGKGFTIHFGILLPIGGNCMKRSQTSNLSANRVLRQHSTHAAALAQRHAVEEGGLSSIGSTHYVVILESLRLVLPIFEGMTLRRPRWWTLHVAFTPQDGPPEGWTRRPCKQGPCFWVHFSEIVLSFERGSS